MVTGLVGNNILHTAHSVTIVYYSIRRWLVYQYSMTHYNSAVYRSQEILLSFDVYCNSLLVDQLRSKPEQENNEITVALHVHMVWYISDCTVTDRQTGAHVVLC